jgi:hypothetical protein
MTPAIVNCFHHHENFACKAGNEKHIHDYHAKCNICSFEFFVFSQSVQKAYFQKILHTTFNFIFYKSANLKLHSFFSFLLRTPPKA